MNETSYFPVRLFQRFDKLELAEGKQRTLLWVVHESSIKYLARVYYQYSYQGERTFFYTFLNYLPGNNSLLLRLLRKQTDLGNDHGRHPKREAVVGHWLAVEEIDFDTRTTASNARVG